MSRRLRMGTAIIAGSVLLLSLLGFFLFAPVARWAVRNKVVPKAEAKLGRAVTIGKIDVKLDRVRMVDVSVRGDNDGDAPLMHFKEVTVEIDVIEAVFGDIKLGRVWVHEPEIALSRNKDGVDNWRDLEARLRRKTASSAAGASGKRALRPTIIEVRDGRFSLKDEVTGTTMGLQGITGRLLPSGQALFELSNVSAESRFGPSLLLSHVAVSADLKHPFETLSVAVSGGRVKVLPNMVLTGIAGSVLPKNDGRAVISFSGGYGGAEGTLWNANGWVDPLRLDGQLNLRAERFTFDRIAKILEGGPVRHPEKASIDTSLVVEMVRGNVSMRGSVHLEGLTLYDPWVAEKPLRDLGFTGSIAANYDRKKRRLDLEELAVRFRDLRVLVDAFVFLPGGIVQETGEVRQKPRVELHVVVPRVNCNRAIRAIPPALAPRLQGFDLRGTYKMDMRLDVDFENLDEATLDGIDGTLGFSRCRVKEAPKRVDTERLQEEFRHVVEIEEDHLERFVVGPSNPDYVPLPEVSPFLTGSLMTTEDSGFYTHQGFIVREFRSALIRNIEAGTFKYGASSITMQLVKNVLLNREKTISRKIQELFLTYYVEQTLSKDRILEIYVNVIEFGPEIYGIGPAARHYFGKTAAELNPVESAFFSSILPSPKSRYLQYCKGKLTRWGGNKIQRILKKMRERDRLTDDEYQLALNTPLVFHFREDHSPWRCKKRVQKLLEKTRRTLPSRDANFVDEEQDD